MLASEASFGYEDILNTQVVRFNGHKVNNLREVVALVDTCKDGYLDFDLEYNQKVILDVKKVGGICGRRMVTVMSFG